MERTTKTDFITQKSGLKQEMIQTISDRCKYIEIPAQKAFEFTQEDLVHYSFFVVNNEGAVLFPIYSIDGFEWRIILSSQMYFPYSAGPFDSQLVFKNCYACRTCHLVAIRNEDVKWLRQHSEKFQAYMENGIRMLLNCVISRQSFCHNVHSKDRIRAAIILALVRYGYDMQSGERIVHFRQRDIAALSGTTVQSVCNVVNDLKKLNILRTRRKSIIMEREYFEKYRNQID